MMMPPATLPELTTNRPDLAARRASDTTLPAPRDRSEFHQTLEDASRREPIATPSKRTSRESTETPEASATPTQRSSEADRPQSADRADSGERSEDPKPEGTDQLESQASVQTAQTERHDAQTEGADHALPGVIDAPVELAPVEISLPHPNLDGRQTQSGPVTSESASAPVIVDARALDAADAPQQSSAPIAEEQIVVRNLQATATAPVTNAVHAADAATADVKPTNTSEQASSAVPIPVVVGPQARSVSQHSGQAPDTASANTGAPISTPIAPEQAGAGAGDSSTEKKSSHGETQNKQSNGAPSDARTPALGRAVQIDHAVRLENATGQQAATPEIVGKSAIAPSPAVTAPGVSASAGVTGQAGAVDVEQADPMMSRVLRGVTAAVNQRGGALTMRLDPPELGRLRIQMTITQGTVTAQFHAETAQTHDLLQRSLATLRASLESQGLTVERLTVHAPQATQHSAMRHESSEQQSQSQQQRHDADAGQGESRGRHDESSTRDGSRQDHEFREFTGFDFDFDFDEELQPVGVQTS